MSDTKSIESETPAAMWMCPVCNHVMTEEQSKGYRGCPIGMHFAQHVPVELVPCPDCYGGHFRPCQVCGDTGMATRLALLAAGKAVLASATPSAKEHPAMYAAWKLMRAAVEKAESPNDELKNFK